MSEPTDESKRSEALATKWLKAIGDRRNKEKNWRTERAPAVIKRYRDERETGSSDVAKFDILWANTETLKPAIFSRMPVPDVRRRFTTADPAARTASLILERCLAYSTDAYDLHDTLDRCNEDYVLPGRAQCVIRYVPTWEKQQKRIPVAPLPETDEPESTVRDELQVQMSQKREPKYPEGTQFDASGGYRMEESENLVYQEVCAEYVAWDFFVFGEAKTWKKVPWVATGALLRKEELKARYPHFKNLDELQYTHSERESKDGQKEDGHFALIWDVWHKASRTFIVVAEGYNDGVIFEQDDPLQLEGFYPMPEPMYSVRTNKTWEPRPEFLLYQDQANELDIITERLRALTEMLKVRGAYDQSIDNETFKFSDILRKPDGTMQPIAAWRALQDKGGFEGVMDFLPLAEIIEAIQVLTEREERVKQTIYEITGISDIVRGSTKASETLGAQQLKAQYAGLRVSTRQQRFQRFTREIYRIQAELIAEHFDPQTLKLMSGIEVIPDQAFTQMKLQKKLPAGGVSESEFAKALQILRSDKLRGFKVDIETDSTIPADREGEQQGRVEFLSAVASFVQQVGPAVAQGYVPLPVAREMLMFGVRGFKVGSELEEVLEQLGQDPNQQEQGPSQQQVAQMQEQMNQLQQENEQLKADRSIDMQKAASDQRIAEYKTQVDAQIKQSLAAQDMELKQRQADQDLRLEKIMSSLEIRLKEQKAEQQQELADQQAQATAREPAGDE